MALANIVSETDSLPEAAFQAAGRGEEAALLAWLDSGGQVNATCRKGAVSSITALLVAAGNGQERVVDLLIQRGAEVDLQSSAGHTALMFAARSGQERVVDLLIQRGAEVDLQNSRKETALGFAAHTGHPAVVLRLLRAGADTKLRTTDGKSALQLAKEQGHSACVEAFRQHIAEVTARQREAAAGGAGSASSGEAVSSSFTEAELGSLTELGRELGRELGSVTAAVAAAGRGDEAALLSWLEYSDFSTTPSSTLRPRRRSDPGFSLHTT